jgi:hypothetical protein
VDAFKDIFDRAIPGGTRITGGGGRLFSGKLPTAKTTSTFPANVERWRPLVAAHFPPGVVDEALSVMECESEGNPTARNPTSGASGLFQHKPEFWASRSSQAGVPNGSITDPIANVKVAAWLYGQSGTWKHWSCQPSVPIGGGGGRVEQPV